VSNIQKIKVKINNIDFILDKVKKMNIIFLEKRSFGCYFQGESEMFDQDVLFRINSGCHRELISVASAERALKRAYPVMPWYCIPLMKLGDQLIRAGQKVKAQAAQKNTAAPLAR